MKKQIAAAVLSGMLVLGSVVPALAQEEAATGTVSITGTPGFVTVAPINFEATTLDGTIQSVDTAAPVEWAVEDLSGTGSGWTVNIKATAFTINEAGPNQGETIPLTGFEVALPETAINPETGTLSPEPISPLDEATALTAADQLFLSAAADTGMGKYTLTPAFTLELPVATYAGNYVSTVTVTYSAGNP
jgi:hypothetical protein